jgi:ribonucleoside-diphosphate reductase alpha chain
MPEYITPRKRPKVTTGDTTKISTGCGNIYVTVNRDEEGICEVFSTLGKTGGCASSQLEGLSRLISMALRSNVSIETLIDELKGIRCPSPMNVGTDFEALSCADVIATVLAEHIGIKIKKEKEKHGASSS